MKYPLKHLSIRVPWHDNEWNGTTCKQPCHNDSCLKLPRISENRNDKAEEKIAGVSIEYLEQNDWPACVAERGMFMSPFGFTRVASHPYAKTSLKTHGHFEATPLYHPSFSAPAVPFRWMRTENMDSFAERYNLDIDSQREPPLDFTTGWVQEKSNQSALLDCFANHFQEEKSLCFFYAKRVPFVEEDYRRVIVGVGRLKKVGDLTPYKLDLKQAYLDCFVEYWRGDFFGAAGRCQPQTAKDFCSRFLLRHSFTCFQHIKKANTNRDVRAPTSYTY